MRTNTVLGERVHISLYRDVVNAADLRKRLIAASTAIGDEGNAEREKVNFAFLNATMVRLRLYINTLSLHILKAFRSVALSILKLLFNKRY